MTDEEQYFYTEGYSRQVQDNQWLFGFGTKNPLLACSNGELMPCTIRYIFLLYLETFFFFF